MKLRDPRDLGTPELVIIPMIDIMFFLLVFFMLSTMYMVEQKTIPVQLPQATSSTVDVNHTFSVTLKQDGSIYLGQDKIDLDLLLIQAQAEQKRDKNFAIIIRADQDLGYGRVIGFMDALKRAGITRFGLATDEGVNP